MHSHSNHQPVQSTGAAFTPLAWLAFGGAAVMLLWFLSPLVRGRVYIEDDLSALVLPMRHFYSHCLASGDSFLWMPHLVNGFYLHGEGHAGMLHPLHLFLYRLLPLDTAFMLEIFLNYPFALAGMYLFLRRWAIPAHAALFGGLLFAFAGFNMNHYVHVSFVAGVAHLPWALWAIDRVLRGAGPRDTLVGHSALLAASASGLLLGNPHGAYFCWLIEGLYALGLALTLRRGGRLLALGVTQLFAVACAMIQLLPSWEALQLSLRAAPTADYQLSISLHPCNLFQLFSPYLFHRRVYAPIKGDEPWDAPYFGAAGLVLVVLLVVRARHVREGRALVIAALLLAATGLVVCLGKYGFLQHVLTLVPLANKLRGPARYGALVHTGAAVAASVAFAHLAATVYRGERIPWKTLWPAGVPVVISGAIALAAAIWRITAAPEALAGFNVHVMPGSRLWLGVALLAAAAALTLAAGRGSRAALAALVVFTVADLSLYGLRHKPSEPLEKFIARIDVPDVPEGTRIDPDIQPYSMNLVGMRGMRGVFGYLNLYPDRALDYTKEIPLRLAGVQWRQARVAAGPALAEAARRGENWVPFPKGLPRARLVTQAYHNRQPAANLARIDVAQAAFVDQRVTLDLGKPGEAAVMEDRPGRIAVHTETPGRQLLVVNESKHPGWVAYVDGLQTAPLTAYGDFLACVVPKGRHEVRFVFAPQSYRVGRGISIIGAALAIAWLAVVYRAAAHASRNAATT